MEACCGAHHLGRVLRAHGHEVRLMSPEYVRAYVKSQKNDDRDAEAIAEAATRPTMRFVELKNEEQLDMQTLHRARDRLVGERTALINQLRAVLLERGIIVAQGRRKLERQLTMASCFACSDGRWSDYTRSQHIERDSVPHELEPHAKLPSAFDAFLAADPRFQAYGVSVVR
jgi:transposase